MQKKDAGEIRKIPGTNDPECGGIWRKADKKRIEKNGISVTTNGGEPV